jgi:hypothetical protein
MDARSRLPESLGGYTDLHAGLVKNVVHAILVDSDGAPASPILKEIFDLLQKRHSDGDRTPELINLIDLDEGQHILDFAHSKLTAKDILVGLRAFRMQSLHLINEELWLTPATPGGEAMSARSRASRYTRWVVAIHARDLRDCEGNIGMFLSHCRAAGITVIVKTDTETLAAETPFNKSLLSNCLHAIIAPGSGVPNGPRNDTEDLQIYWLGMQRKPEPRPSFWRRWFIG